MSLPRILCSVITILFLCVFNCTAPVLRPLYHVPDIKLWKTFNSLQWAPDILVGSKVVYRRLDHLPSIGYQPSSPDLIHPLPLGSAQLSRRIRQHPRLDPLLPPSSS